jgi:phosphatidylserine/phosphatidylglycerophosphate/cardiolipin synthase-like enzyme
VLISSINWNENSVMNNRETGVIIKNKDIASYYADVFFFDWNLNNTMTPYRDLSTTQETMDDNTIYIVSIFTMTFVLIARDWRKRRWN